MNTDIVDSIDKHLEHVIVSDESLTRVLKESILYSLKAKSKRLRPKIFISLCADLDPTILGNPQRESSVLNIAAAIELIHISSLIHDDLPSIDNDSSRWGKPTNHLIYGEGVALLAADSLIAKSFELLTADSWCPVTQLKVISILSSTFIKLCSGQALDITKDFSGSQNEEKIKPSFIDELKTGALFSSCFTIAVVTALRVDAQNQPASQAIDKMYSVLEKLGRSFGNLFQQLDDHQDNRGGFAEQEILNEKEKLLNEINAFIVSVDDAALRLNRPLNHLRTLLQKFFEEEVFKIR